MTNRYFDDKLILRDAGEVMKKIIGFIMFLLILFTCSACEYKATKQYIVNPFIKTIKEQYAIDIDKAYFTIYINPRDQNDYYSKLEFSTMMLF